MLTFEIEVASKDKEKGFDDVLMCNCEKKMHW